MFIYIYISYLILSYLCVYSDISCNFESIREYQATRRFSFLWKCFQPPQSQPQQYPFTSSSPSSAAAAAGDVRIPRNATTRSISPSLLSSTITDHASTTVPPPRRRRANSAPNRPLSNLLDFVFTEEEDEDEHEEAPRGREPRSSRPLPYRSSPNVMDPSPDEQRLRRSSSSSSHQYSALSNSLPPVTTTHL